MMPLQTIILLTTGFFLPPVLAIEPAAPETEHRVVVKFQQDAQSADAADLHAVLMAAAAPLHEIVEAKGIEPGGPWLGIQFGPVSKPLAAHLGIDAAKGQMVLNVIEGSPADDAGLQQYDVITKIDGNATSADVAGFLEVVHGFEPGQTHDFVLVRNGNDTQVSVTVGTRPESTVPSTFKFEMQPGPFSQGKVFQRGGMLQKGPDGAWSFNALDQLQDLPDNVFKFMPKFGDGDMTFSWKGDTQDAKVLKFMTGGSNLQIERGDDGRITVTKTEKEDGNEATSTATYADEEEFEAADRDTFRSYKAIVQFRVLADTSLPGFHFVDKMPFGDFMFKKDYRDMDDLDADLNRLVEQLKKMLGHHKIIIKKRLGSSADPAAHAFFVNRKASVSFEVDPDGAIRVTTRQGDEELIENYDNPAQLEAARPELFEKYQNLKQAKPE